VNQAEPFAEESGWDHVVPWGCIVTDTPQMIPNPLLVRSFHSYKELSDKHQ